MKKGATVGCSSVSASLFSLSLFYSTGYLVSSLWVHTEEQQVLSFVSWWLSHKEPTFQGRRCKRCDFDPWVGRIPWRRKWQATLVFLPGKSHGQRSLVGYSPWGCKEAKTAEQLSTYTHSVLYQGHSSFSFHGCGMNE